MRFIGYLPAIYPPITRHLPAIHAPLGVHAPSGVIMMRYLHLTKLSRLRALAPPVLWTGLGNLLEVELQFRDRISAGSVPPTTTVLA